jgi:hypothetical protein
MRTMFCRHVTSQQDDPNVVAMREVRACLLPAARLPFLGRHCAARASASASAATQGAAQTRCCCAACEGAAAPVLPLRPGGVDVAVLQGSEL